MDLLAYAKEMSARVEMQAARLDVPVAVSVIDVHGNIILKHRMNGAPVFAADLSERKAYTSAVVGIRTADMSALVQPGQPLFPMMSVSGGKYFSMGGGAPLRVDGQLVAGVGVSGGTVDQDVEILEAGLREPVPASTPDMKLEVVVIPVSDVDRAKQFYGSLGWRLDLDYASGDDYRVIQFTPPGSRCSIIFGKGVASAAPGSSKDVHLVVSDVEAVRNTLLGRGIAVSELFHDGGGVFHHASSQSVLSGPNPQHKSYASYAAFKDPDGNGWVLQEVTARLTGPIAAGDTSFTPELTNAVERAFARAKLDRTPVINIPPQQTIAGEFHAQ